MHPCYRAHIFSAWPFLCHTVKVLTLVAFMLQLHPAAEDPIMLVLDTLIMKYFSRELSQSLRDRH